MCVCVLEKKCKNRAHKFSSFVLMMIIFLNSISSITSIMQLTWGAVTFWHNVQRWLFSCRHEPNASRTPHLPFQSELRVEDIHPQIMLKKLYWEGGRKWGLNPLVYIPVIAYAYCTHAHAHHSWRSPVSALMRWIWENKKKNESRWVNMSEKSQHIGFCIR